MECRDCIHCDYDYEWDEEIEEEVKFETCKHMEEAVFYTDGSVYECEHYKNQKRGKR